LNTYLLIIDLYISAHLFKITVWYRCEECVISTKSLQKRIQLVSVSW